jgi:outer membrane protein assembly factor BamB
MAPTFVPASLGNMTSGNDSVIIGQKNGIMYSLDAESGDSQWIVPTSPDGDQGGLSWGLGIDAANIYFTAINYGSEEWHLIPSGIEVNNSAFGAMSLKEGTITWETAVPRMDYSYTAPTLVNDMLLVGASGKITAGRGSLMALTKADGKILLDMPVDSILRGGIAVQDQYVMFGTGYSYANPLGNGSFYVMKLK